MIRVFGDADQLHHAAAELFVERSASAISNRGCFRVGLAGGSTPRPVYQLLATPAYRERVDWSAVRIFWGDERCVPPDDERSNARMAKETLLDHVPIPKEQIHPISCIGDAGVAAQEYEDLLRTEFEGSNPRFDLLWLGVGTDGHTASLFPGSAGPDHSQRWVNAAHKEGEKFQRVTLTIATINQAELVCFLVTGSEKAHAVAAAVGNAEEAVKLPAGRVSPIHGSVYWYVDEAAAALTAR